MVFENIENKMKKLSYTRKMNVQLSNKIKLLYTISTIKYSEYNGIKIMLNY